MKNLIFYVVLLLFLNSCGAVQDGFSRNKKDNTDEFLVEKKILLNYHPIMKSCPYLILEMYLKKMKTIMI